MAKSKENLGVDHMLQAEEHSKRLFFGSGQILLKAESFALRHHNPSRRLLRRVQDYLRVGLLQRHHFLQITNHDAIDQYLKLTKPKHKKKRKKKVEIKSVMVVVNNVFEMLVREMFRISHLSFVFHG